MLRFHTVLLIDQISRTVFDLESLNQYGSLFITKCRLGPDGIRMTTKRRILMNKYMIREVKLEDAERLAEIYSYYVQNTAISFEYDAPSASEFENRIRNTTAKYPYLVCEKNGYVVGYSYASAYSVRSAYAWTATSSIYVDKDYRRQGIGSMLYNELEKRLREQGIVNLLAGAAYCEKEDEYLTHDSYKFHTIRGYEKVAHLKTIGKKFDRWYDLIWMQKKL